MNQTPDSQTMSDEAVEERKGSMRRQMAQRRNARHAHERDRLSAQLAEVALPHLRTHGVVAAYVSYQSELDMLPILEALQEDGTRVLVPKLGPGLSRDWAWFISTEDLRENAPGRPLEPSGEALGAEVLAEADAIVVPALAVDREGMRLGRGGGWYDRALQFRREDVPVYCTLYDEELLQEELVPRHEHDIPVTHVLTPSGITEVGAQEPRRLTA